MARYKTPTLTGKVTACCPQFNSISWILPRKTIRLNRNTTLYENNSNTCRTLTGIRSIIKVTRICVSLAMAATAPMNTIQIHKYLANSSVQGTTIRATYRKKTWRITVIRIHTKKIVEIFSNMLEMIWYNFFIIRLSGQIEERMARQSPPRFVGLLTNFDRLLSVIQTLTIESLSSSHQAPRVSTSFWSNPWYPGQSSERVPNRDSDIAFHALSFPL